MTFQDDDGAGIAPGGDPAGEGDHAPEQDGDSGGSTGDANLDQIVADAEADLISGDGDADEDPDDEDGSGIPKARSTAATSRLSKIEKFLKDNYDGDEDAFLAGVYQSRDEGRRLSERLKELESKLQNPTSPSKQDLEAEFKSARETDVEVQQIDQRLANLDKNIRGIDARQQQIVNDANALTNEIKSLTSRRDRATDPDELRIIERDLHDRRLEYTELKSEFSTNEVRKVSAAERKDDLALLLSKAEKEVRARLTAKQQEEQSLQQSAQQWNADLNRAFENEIKAYDVKPGSPRAKYLYHATRTMLIDWLSQQSGPALDASGMRRAVAELLSSAAETFSLQRRTASTPGARTAARPGAQSRQPRPALPGHVADSGKGSRRTPGPARSPKSRDELLNDPDAVRARANAIFEKVAQASRGGKGLPS